MNKKNTILICLFFFCLLSAGCLNDESGNPDNESVIRISGAYALYPLMLTWAEKYQDLHPGIKIEVSAGGAGKGMTDMLTGQTDIGMVSRDLYPEEVKQGAVGIAVAKDAVVLTSNVNNPHLEYLNAHGLNRSVLEEIFISQKITRWNQVDPDGQDLQIHVYTRADSCGAAEIWAKYLGKKQENLKGTGVSGDPGVAEAVRQDLISLGYNNINYAYDPKTGLPVSGIAVIPLDLDDDHLISPDESWYSTREEILLAIASGAYPSPPARDLYLVGKDTFSPEVKGFLEWIISDGQKYASPSGYIPLTPEMALEMNQTIMLH